MTMTRVEAGLVDFVERHGLWDTARQAKAAEVLEEAKGLRCVRVVWSDQHGIPRAKSLSPEAFAGAMRSGLKTNTGTVISDSSGAIVFDPFSDGGGFEMEAMTGAPDIVLVPDPTTFRVLPWVDGTGWILCDMHFDTGAPMPFCSRQILRRSLEAAAATGVELVVGIEIEWHLLRLDPERPPRSDVGDMGAPPEPAAMLPVGFGYQHQAESDLDALDPILAPLQECLVALGLPLRTAESEYGPSQLEFTFAPMPALEAADAALLFRSATKQICRRHGYHASFMSRPRMPGFLSSGWHLHVSAVDEDTGRNAFISDDAGSVLSPFGTHFVGGLVAHASEAAVFTAPTVNAYKRYRPNSLAPDRANWGRDNRGAMIRVCGTQGDPSTHVENRAGEPAANPYLYVASQVIAGLDGVASETDPGPATDTPYLTRATALPRNLGDAIAALDGSSLFRGAMGDAVVDFILAHKRSEFSRYQASVGLAQDDAAVTDWEHREYFDVF